MLPYCKFHGIGVIPYSPLAGGLLARPRESAETPRHKLSSSLGLIKMDEADTEIIKRVEEIAKNNGPVSWVFVKKIALRKKRGVMS